MHRISEWKLTLFCIQKNPRSEGNLNPRKYIGIFSLLFKDAVLNLNATKHQFVAPVTVVRLHSLGAKNITKNTFQVNYNITNVA